MKPTCKTLGVLLTVGTFAAATWAVDDKPATNAAVVVAPAVPTTPKTDPANDPVLVKGKGFEIKRSQFYKGLEDLKKEAAAGGQEIPAAELAGVEPKLLNHLILTHLLEARATDADKAKGKADAELRVEQLKKEMQGEEMLATMLKAQGMTLEGLKTQLTTEGISHAVLRNTINVTDDQIKKYYDGNPAKFEEPEKVRASHILIGTMNPKTGDELSDTEKLAKKKQAEALLKRARDGEDFAKLAKEFSDDPGSKDKGGEYTFGRKEMMPEFEDAAFALRTNQVSDIVTTKFGYHIIKLSERIPGRRIELAKARDEIRETLEDDEIEKQLPKLFVQWRKDANVEILDEKMKAKDEAEAAEVLKAAEKPPEAPAPQKDKGK